MAHQHSTHPDTIDKLLTLLANKYCRSTVTYFRDSSEDVASVEDIANEMSKKDQRGADRFGLQLHHSVLPRLVDAGVLTYDAKTNTVLYRGHAEPEALLDGIQNATR